MRIPKLKTGVSSFRMEKGIITVMNQSFRKYLISPEPKTL
jgi:hypothetical protein